MKVAKERQHGILLWPWLAVVRWGGGGGSKLNADSPFKLEEAPIALCFLKVT